MEQLSQKPLRFVHLAVATLLFCLLFFLSYPHYRYFVDPDAVAYLTMARRAAEGDVWRLVNALWSPFHPALVSLCARNGMDVLLAAQLTNGLACVAVLGCTFELMRRAKVSAHSGFPALLALSGFLCYALYKQLFCDLWQTGFLFGYLIYITCPGTLKHPLRWIICGLLLALASYSKVYSFYFLLLHLPIGLYLLAKNNGQRFPWKAYSTLLVVQLLALMPWVFLMHQKYGVWKLSMSGALNTSWTLVGHKSPADSIKALIPPPYPNSPYTWEDPYLAEGALHGRFESLSMIKSQIGHSILAGTQFVEALGQISLFLLPVLLVAGYMAWAPKLVNFSKVEKFQKPLLLAAAIMPLGYLLLHVEARYIWLLLPIGMILGAQLLDRIRPFLGNKSWTAACWLFAISFIVWPVHDMKALFHVGADVREDAITLKKHGIEGRFSSNDNPSRSGLLAYWMEGNFYTPVSENVNPQIFAADLKRHNVRYFFEYIKGPRLSDHLNSVSPDRVRQLDIPGIPGLRVYELLPE